MKEKVRYFHADYRDGRVHIGGKVYQAGVFATHLLNQYYKDDTAARIAVFTTDNLFIQRKLNMGYIKVSEFVSAGERTLNLFNALPWLQPFTMLDTNAERNRVAELFSRENGEQIKKSISAAKPPFTVWMMIIYYSIVCQKNMTSSFSKTLPPCLKMFSVPLNFTII